MSFIIRAAMRIAAGKGINGGGRGVFLWRVGGGGKFGRRGGCRRVVGAQDEVGMGFAVASAMRLF